MDKFFSNKLSETRGFPAIVGLTNNQSNDNSITKEELQASLLEICDSLDNLFMFFNQLNNKLDQHINKTIATSTSNLIREKGYETKV